MGGWNKGLTKETDIRVKKNAEAIKINWNNKTEEEINKWRERCKNIDMRGWNKGLTKETDPRVAKNAEAIKESRKNLPKIIPSIETRKLWSLQRKGKQVGKDNPMYGVTPSIKCHRGRGSYYQSPLQGQVYLRSTWELKYAQYLDSQRVLWYYEIETFDLGDTTYTPDFFLPRLEKFVEIKGYMNQKSQEKINKFQEEYPWNLEILMKKDLKDLGIEI